MSGHICRWGLRGREPGPSRCLVPLSGNPARPMGRLCDHRPTGGVTRRSRDGSDRRGPTHAIFLSDAALPNRRVERGNSDGRLQPGDWSKNRVQPRVTSKNLSSSLREARGQHSGPQPPATKSQRTAVTRGRRTVNGGKREWRRVRSGPRLRHRRKVGEPPSCQ